MIPKNPARIKIISAINLFFLSVRIRKIEVNIMIKNIMFCSGCWTIGRRKIS